MLTLIAYDISDPKRLRRVAETCENFGVRVQYSVFECRLAEDEFEDFWLQLLEDIDEDEDRIVAYKIAAHASDIARHRPGARDRRQKQLRLTADGAKLEAELFEALRSQMAAAYVQAGQGSVTGFWQVLEGLIPPEDRKMVLGLRG